MSIRDIRGYLKVRDMKCYKCNSVMKKKSFDGVLIDACPTCEGIWLDYGELDMIKNKEALSKEEILDEARKELIIDKKRLMTTAGLCPKCQKTSLAETILCGVKVDICPSCDGIYFDWGELQSVLSTKSGGVGDFIRNIARRVRFK